MTYTERLIREARSHADISQLQEGARSLILEMADALEAQTKTFAGLRHAVYDVDSGELIAATATAGASVRVADSYEQYGNNRKAEIRKLPEDRQ